MSSTSSPDATTSTPSTAASPINALPVPSPPASDPIRRALETNPDVTWEMLGRHQPRGLFLCGYDLLGRTGPKLFLAATCHDYSTGPGASILSGSGLAFVATIEGDHFTNLEFPRQQPQASDEERPFPPGILQTWRSRQVTMTPSEKELLAEARQLGSTPASSTDSTSTPASTLSAQICRAADLGIAWKDRGEGAGGHYLQFITLTNHGVAASRLSGYPDRVQLDRTPAAHADCHRR